MKSFFELLYWTQCQACQDWYHFETLTTTTRRADTRDMLCLDMTCRLCCLRLEGNTCWTGELLFQNLGQGAKVALFSHMFSCHHCNKYDNSLLCLVDCVRVGILSCGMGVTGSLQLTGVCIGDWRMSLCVGPGYGANWYRDVADWSGWWSNWSIII